MIKIEKNEFDSSCFERDVYLLEILSDEYRKVEYSKKTERITNELNSLNEFPYIICKHKLSDLPVIHALESTRFQIISVDIELKAKVSKPSETRNEMENEFLIEKVNQTHENYFTNLLNNIQSFFNLTHFCKSPYFDNYLCDDFYKNWILKNVKGRTDENYIALYEKEIIGFIFGKKKDLKINIDLLWVNENFRRLGLGKFLVLSLIRNNKCEEIIVNTQIDNYSAVKLYTKMGFTITEVLAVYHKNNRA